MRERPMMGSFDEYPPNIRAILEKVADVGYRDILLDEEAGNRFLFETLATSNDATLREIGDQLRGGAIDLRQLAASDHYREALNGGGARLLEFDPEQLAEDLDRATGEPRDIDAGSRDREDGDTDRTADDPDRLRRG
ncbi:hypothetical protein HC031_05745 [Planosporangium thailandense]|uniref:Uncharacterized protein n=1 Tax=Planosporangium thailandense TaxID=765197 RepID=A0ABX0XV71_9ACTN|nr:hypothetical protein [Planosporangium thailandense]NJC69222.1 hypothetical protein [Planosporangium thailandense]